MKYSTKAMWEKALGNIDERYTNEAAEFLCSVNGEKLENYPDSGERPVEIKARQPLPLYKRILPVVGGFAAAAAAVAGIYIAVTKYPPAPVDSTSSSPGTSLTETTDSTTEEPDEYTVPEFSKEQLKMLADKSNYTSDYEAFEEYFVGGWISADSKEQTVLFDYIPNQYFGYIGTAVPDYVKKTDSGCCFVQFFEPYPTDYEMYYISDDNRDVMYYYFVRANPDDLEAYTYKPNSVIIYVRRDIENNATTLSMMGLKRLCEQYDIDWQVLSQIKFSANDGSLFELYYAPDQPLSSNQFELLSESEDLIRMTAVFGGVKGSETRLPFELRRTESGWEAFPAAEYTAFTDGDVLFNTRSDEIIRESDAAYKMFLGEWKNILHNPDPYGLGDTLLENNLSHSLCHNGAQTHRLVCCYTAEDGKYAIFNLSDGSSKCMYIPKDNSDVLYVYSFGGYSTDLTETELQTNDFNVYKNNFCEIYVRGKALSKTEKLNSVSEICQCGFGVAALQAEYGINLPAGNICFKDESDVWRQTETETYTILTGSEEFIVRMNFAGEKHGSRMFDVRYFKQDGEWLWSVGGMISASEQAVSAVKDRALYDKYYAGEWFNADEYVSFDDELFERSTILCEQAKSGEICCLFVEENIDRVGVYIYHEADSPYVEYFYCLKISGGVSVSTKKYPFRETALNEF